MPADSTQSAASATVDAFLLEMRAIHELLAEIREELRQIRLASTPTAPKSES